MKNILQILILLCAMPTLSQTIDVQGRVYDNEGCLPGVAIAIMVDSSSYKIRGYAITDAEGRFWIKSIDTVKNNYIRARLMGYKEVKVPLDTNLFVFELEKSTVTLEEVKIKAQKISGAGDTTLYVAEAFVKKNDVTLADVINRMPDLYVSDKGKVKYQGKEISNFYIEGSNIMGSKYPVAVKSIHQQDVGSVELIEKHQPIKLFENLIFSDQTAINIKLKQRAKRKWTGFMQVGGGLSNLWQADINLMRFGKQIKTLNTYKSNNIGVDVAKWGTPAPKTDGYSPEDARTLINIRHTNNPFIDRQKTLFNTSHLLSLNNQVTLGKILSLSPQLNIVSSTFDNQIIEEKRYFLDKDKVLNIVSNETGIQKYWNINPTIRLEMNTKKMYLINMMTADFSHQKDQLTIIGSHPNQENSRMDYFKWKNDLYMMRKWGKKIVGIKSINSWSKRPQTIEVQQANVLLAERLETSMFSSQTKINQSFIIGKSTLSLEEGYTFSQEALSTSLLGLESGELSNDFKYRKMLLFVKPSLSMRWASVQLRFTLPISYNINAYTDKIAHNDYYRNKLLVSPTTNLMWDINNRVSVSMGASWETLPQYSSHFFTHEWLTSFPYLQKGSLFFNDIEKTNINTSLRYKNILKGVFANLFFQSSWQHNTLMPIQYFDKVYIVSGMDKSPHTSRQQLLVGNISYMLDAIRGEIAFKGSYSFSNSYFLQYNSVQHANTKFKQLGVTTYSELNRYVEIDYAFTYSQSNNKMANNREQEDYNMSQQLSATYMPHDKINFVLTAYHYHNNLANQTYNTSLLDFKINYTLSSSWQFQLTAYNILNQKNFIYKYYTGMMTYEQTYKLRPFSLLLSVKTTF